MAKLITRMYQNMTNNEKTYGKFYGRVVHTETLSTDDFARHISNHGSPFTRSVIAGVLAAACDCLVELVKDSKKVRLGDLGTFYLSAESTGAESADTFSADNVKRVHLRFLPNLKRSYPLDSVTLRKQVSLGSLEAMMGTESGDGGNRDGGSTGSDNPVVEQPGD